MTLFEAGPGSLSIQTQTFTALGYLQFSLETRWLGFISWHILSLTSKLQWGRLKPRVSMRFSQLQYNMFLVDEPNSVQTCRIPFVVFTYVLKSLRLLGSQKGAKPLNSQAGKHAIVSLQWLMLANAFKPSLCVRSTAAAVQIMFSCPTLISCSDTRCNHSIDNERLTWIRVCNNTLLMF